MKNWESKDGLGSKAYTVEKQAKDILCNLIIKKIVWILYA